VVGRDAEALGTDRAAGCFKRIGLRLEAQFGIE